MTAELIELIAANGVFRPRGHFTQLAADHVPFDRLVGQARYETAALQALGSDAPVGVVGPRGAGKSSLIAHVCAHLPKRMSRCASRSPAPMTPPASPSSPPSPSARPSTTSISTATSARRSTARADQDTQNAPPGGLRGATLGGGPIPAQVHAELGTLREELTTNRLAAERLSGLDRLITILVARGLQPIFVLEDTEAAIGGADQPDVAAAFLAGPVHAFVSELETPIA